MFRNGLFKRKHDLSRTRFVLCRPEGGLNDMLCQIEVACAYAETSKRLVVVDANYRNARAFRDKFSAYFSSRGDRMILDSDAIDDAIEDMTTVPACLSGRLNSYQLLWNDDILNWADAETGQELSFDVERLYDERLLLHHACGGGQHSLNALARLVLHDELVDRLARRIDAIGEPYSGIHIRNTDYQTDYEPALAALKGMVPPPVFIATDNVECRQCCIDLFGAQAVKYFSALPDEPGITLHMDYRPASIFERNAEVVLDLLTLALSSDFFKVPLRPNRHDTVYSGFSILAENLRNAPKVLASLLGSGPKAKAIMRKTAAWRRRRATPAARTDTCVR